MKIFLIYISIIIVNTVFISCTSTQEATQQQEISQQEPQKKYTSAVKILSINTLHLLQDKTDVEKFAIWLKSTEAEIITLQQIERPTEGKSGFNAAAELAKAMDTGTYNACFCRRCRTQRCQCPCQLAHPREVQYCFARQSAIY